MNFTEADERFLEGAMLYVDHNEVEVAHLMLDQGLSLEKACARFGHARKVVVMALQGRLKRAVVRNGRVAPGAEYVDPWLVEAVIDHDDVRQMAAFAIYRTVQPREGEPTIFRRGARVQ